MTDRFSRALAAIDAANSDDPETIVIDGRAQPKELAHAEAVTEWVRRLDPEPSQAQLLAARAHHLRRWTRPRSDYPQGRAGYLRWRTAARKAHAAEVASILGEVGYDQFTIQRVAQLVAKQASDPEAQTHEDALCLVFIQTQLSSTTERLGADKTLSVLAKTWAKMSVAAREAALALQLNDEQQSLLEKALERFADGQ